MYLASHSVLCQCHCLVKQHSRNDKKRKKNIFDISVPQSWPRWAHSVSHTRVTVERSIKFGIDQNRDAAANCWRLAPWLMPAARRRHPRFSAIFDSLFDRLPVRISTSDLHHWILLKKIFHIRAYDFGVQFSFNARSNWLQKMVMLVVANRANLKNFLSLAVNSDSFGHHCCRGLVFLVLWYGHHCCRGLVCLVLWYGHHCCRGLVCLVLWYGHHCCRGLVCLVLWYVNGCFVCHNFTCLFIFHFIRIMLWSNYHLVRSCDFDVFFYFFKVDFKPVVRQKIGLLEQAPDMWKKLDDPAITDNGESIVKLWFASWMLSSQAKEMVCCWIFCQLFEVVSSACLSSPLIMSLRVSLAIPTNSCLSYWSMRSLSCGWWSAFPQPDQIDTRRNCVGMVM